MNNNSDNPYLENQLNKFNEGIKPALVDSDISIIELAQRKCFSTFVFSPVSSTKIYIVSQSLEQLNLFNLNLKNEGYDYAVGMLLEYPQKCVRWFSNEGRLRLNADGQIDEIPERVFLQFNDGTEFATPPNLEEYAIEVMKQKGKILVDRSIAKKRK